ncbi:MAG: 3',5'-cyclic-AMP phosphodiesterase [Planctomycetota bacterium]
MSAYVIQVTDTHLFAEPEGELLGVETQRSLEAVFEAIAALEVKPDFLLLTGDLSQDGSEKAYRRLTDKIRALETPALWLPGNHDEPEVMRSTLRGEPYLDAPHTELEHWKILALDTKLAGSEAGRLSASELERLTAELDKAQSADQPVLLAMHHPPLPVGSAWVDALGLENSEAFFEVVGRCDCVRLVLCGHVHQEFRGEVERVIYLTTPSTCFQFAPVSEDFGLDPVAPGYRSIWLNDDGTFRTEVTRVEAAYQEVDTSSGGY